MPIAQRLPIYKELEERRECPLIVYVTNERRGLSGAIAGDVLPEIMGQLEKLPKSKSLDFLIVSNGGDPTVAFQIMNLIRERVDDVSVLIPQAAYSAATLLALGANRILMHPNGNLGPLDPQIQVSRSDGALSFASEDVSAFLRFVKEHVGLTDQQHLSDLFQTLCSQIGSVPLGFSARAIQLSVSLGEKLLRTHMREAVDLPKIAGIVESLCKGFYDHGYAVSRKEAKQLGLDVIEPEAHIADLMWNIWIDFEAELAIKSRYSSAIAMMQSPEGAKLATPVPQVNIPAGTPSKLAEKAFWDAIDTVKVNAVDVELVMALVESRRLASRNVDKRKVFGSRTPDLELQFNSVTVWSGWENVAV